MAQLPQVPRRFATAEFAPSRVSGADVASPYRSLAAGMSAAARAEGQGLQDVAGLAEEVGAEISEQEGMNAVERDENGRLTMTPRLPVTRAGRAYNRAARTAYLARLRPEMQTRLSDMARENEGNPEAFASAVEGYIGELANNAGESDPVLHGPVLQMAEAEASRHYEGLVTRKHRRDIDTFKTGIGNEIGRLVDDGLALARTGGTRTQDFEEIRDQVSDLYDELGSNPEFGLNPEWAEAQKVEAEQKWMEAALGGAVERVAEAQGAEAGLKAIDEALGASGISDVRQGVLRREWRRKVLESAAQRLVNEGRDDEARALRDLLPVEEGPTGIGAALRARESSGRPDVVNSLGFAGLYQFGAPRLATLGIYKPGPGEDLSGWARTGSSAPGKWGGTFSIPGHPEVKTLDDFLASPPAQEAAFGIHSDRMDREIEQNGFDKHIGETVGGVEITRDGLHAMLHLGGVGSTRAALNGSGNATDAYGTSVLDYARMGTGSQRSLEFHVDSLIRRRDSAMEASQSAETRAARRIVEDDIASIAATGTGLDDLSFDKVAGILGEAKALDWLEERERQRAIYEHSHDLPALTEAEIMARVRDLEPRPGPGATQRAELQATVAERAGTILKQRAEDPAGAVSGPSFPAVREKLDAYAQAMGDPEASFEDRAAAARDYAREALAAQESVGIPETQRRILPAGFGQRIGQSIEAIEQPQARARQLQAIRAEWGEHWPRVWEQVGPELPPAMQVVGVMDRPDQLAAAERIAEAAAVGVKELEKRVPKERLDDVKARVSDKMGDLAGTYMDVIGGAAAVETWREAIGLLGTWYAANGMSPSAAATRAYDEVIGRKYTIRDTFRVPSHLDAAAVSRGADAAMERLSGFDLDPFQTFSGLPADMVRDQQLGALARNGFWVTAPDDSGLVLYEGETRRAMTRGGQPFVLTWEELLRISPAADLTSPEGLNVP